MSRPALRTLCFALGVLASPGLARAGTGADPLSVLVFTRAEGFVHASIDDGAQMVQELGAAEGWSVTVTDDPLQLGAASLASVDVTVWISTTGDVLDAPQESDFQAWVEGGGGYVGIHAAADCEYGWSWYGELLGGGAWFDRHPAIQLATLSVDTPGLPGTGPWAASFDFRDEWYDFQANPRSSVDVLLTLDESTYFGGGMGDDHPIAWSHAVGAGRSFYTNLGHREQTYADPRFRAHVREGILWAAGRLLFADGFEAADLAGWSEAVAGDASVAPTGAREHARPRRSAPR